MGQGCDVHCVRSHWAVRESGARLSNSSMSSGVYRYRRVGRRDARPSRQPGDSRSDRGVYRFGSQTAPSLRSHRRRGLHHCLGNLRPGSLSGFADPHGRSLCSRMVARSDPHSGACSRKPQGEPSTFRPGERICRSRLQRNRAIPDSACSVSVRHLGPGSKRSSAAWRGYPPARYPGPFCDRAHPRHLGYIALHQSLAA
jgi:hypothetical protein